jgi:hypothetical protein
MVIIIRFTFTVLLLLITSLLFAYFVWYKPKIEPLAAVHPVNSTPAINNDKTAYALLKRKADSLKSFASKNNLNTSTFFLIDMTIESGRNRFFVFDGKQDSVIMQGLVTHGRCNQSWLNGRKFGNDPGCGCTSLGKYKIGYKYSGRFGLAFKLYGLDTTNNNAFKRYVVLHAHECVPEQEIFPAPICQSDGCPTVSTGFLSKLSPIIEQSPKPILLLIF